MSALLAFHGRIAPLVIGCPVPLIDQAVLDACIEFCERSQIIRERLDSMNTEIGQQEVPLETPPQNKLARLMSVQLDGNDLPAATEGNFPGFFTDASQQPSKPTCYIYLPTGDLLFYPIPDAVYTVNVYAVLKPSRVATVVADRLFEDWAEAIASGALARLMAMPGDWNNPVLAQAHYIAFSVAANKALLDSTNERTRASSRIEPVWI